MSRRRYKIGKFPVYDKKFDREKSESFLNPRNVFFDIKFAFGSSPATASMVLEWEGETQGEHKGEYPAPDGWQKSKILIAQEALDAVDAKWKATKAQAKRCGRPIPKEMPADLVNERLKAEAVLDIRQEELDFLKKKLGEWETKETKQKASMILRYGPRGSAKGEPPREIDGQDVVQRDGKLVINCFESPYHNMELPDYFEKIVYPFNRRDSELQQRWAEMTQQERRDYLKQGGRAPNMGLTVPWEDLPPRPDGS
jgi:hypothetical protein